MKKNILLSVLLANMYVIMSYGMNEENKLVITAEQHAMYEKLCRCLAENREPVFEAKKNIFSSEERWQISKVNRKKPIIAVLVEESHKINLNIEKSGLITIGMDDLRSRSIDPIIFLFLKQLPTSSPNILFFPENTEGTKSVRVSVLQESLQSFLKENNHNEWLQERIAKLNMGAICSAIKDIGFDYEKFKNKYGKYVELPKQNYAQLIGKLCLASLLVLGILYWAHLCKMVKEAFV